DLEPVGAGGAVEDARVVLGAQPDTVAEVRKHTVGCGDGPVVDPSPRSLLHLLLSFENLAALLGALVGAAHVGDTLALAAVHALALVAGAGARTLALAGIDTGAVDGAAALLVGGACRQAASQDQGRSRASDQDSLAFHALLLWFCSLSPAGPFNRPGLFGLCYGSPPPCGCRIRRAVSIPPVRPPGSSGCPGWHAGRRGRCSPRRAGGGP